MPRAKNERLAAWPVLDAFDAWEPPPVQKMPPPIGGVPVLPLSCVMMSGLP